MEKEGESDQCSREWAAIPEVRLRDFCETFRDVFSSRLGRRKNTAIPELLACMPHKWDSGRGCIHKKKSGSNESAKRSCAVWLRTKNKEGLPTKFRLVGSLANKGTVVLPP